MRFSANFEGAYFGEKCVPTNTKRVLDFSRQGLSSHKKIAKIEDVPIHCNLAHGEDKKRTSGWEVGDEKFLPWNWIK